MAKQDTWARITLRIPPELHKKLTKAAAEKSLNAEIISRLEESFNSKDYSKIIELIDAIQIVADQLGGIEPPNIDTKSQSNRIPSKKKY
ncbi:toxin-antitoxin system HicB family antitoxin [uncultured Cohaesibacter sp.]|uniref:toxin-antitoxin system HicB family antitoxin n=1 Tax=uncultured Cohaesibacter sp. TaxID=1002546 RepID=UPI0029C75E29|nr:toxin-antitoxin system HicB family antitoxin [uncultured Cohaesibacter sp.]